MRGLQREEGGSYLAQLLLAWGAHEELDAAVLRHGHAFRDQAHRLRLAPPHIHSSKPEKRQRTHLEPLPLLLRLALLRLPLPLRLVRDALLGARRGLRERGGERGVEHEGGHCEAVALFLREVGGLGEGEEEGDGWV